MLGVLCLVLIMGVMTTHARPTETISATLGWEYPWGGGIEYGFFLAFNSTEELTNTTLPTFEINMWIEEEHTPCFPNHSLQFWQFDTKNFVISEDWVHTYVSDLDPVILDEPWDNVSWTVRNESFAWDADSMNGHTNYNDPIDGRFYLSIMFRGVVWVNETQYVGTTLSDTWYNGLTTVTTTYDPAIIYDVQIHHSFMFWTDITDVDPIIYPPIYPVPPIVTTTDITTTTDDVIGFSLISLLVLPIIIKKRRR